MKKLKYSFVRSRTKLLDAIPISWHLTKDRKLFCALDLRLCKLIDLSQQLLFPVSVKNSFNQASNSENINDDFLTSGPEHILSLDLSLNNLCHLKYSDLSLFVELRHLNASFNSIETFLGVSACSHIAHLCLSCNNIKQIPFSVLEECKHLMHLVS